MSEHTTFLASFPAIQSAIKVYGDRQGMRIQLDVPESEMAEALKVLMWREQVLRVTIGPSQQNKLEEDAKPDRDRRMAKGTKWEPEG